MKLVQSEDRTVRYNAAVALLQQRTSLPLPLFREILIRTDEDIGFLKQYSPGKGLSYFKVIPHAHQKTKYYQSIVSETARVRQKVLRASLELPEEEFLKVAKLVFDKKQDDLIPMLVELLSNHRTENAIALLKDEAMHAGAPFIRTYCNLALFRLGEEGPYEENLLQWVKQQHNSNLIRFKEAELPDVGSAFTLTPEETAQLLIETFEALAASQHPKGIEALLNAIAYGNPKNRYALAGLLMRTAQ